MDTEIRENIFELKARGLTYQQVAIEVGFSRQRIQQLFSPTEEQRNQVALRAGGKCESCGEITVNGHVHHKSYNVEALKNVDNLLYLCVSCHLRITEHPTRQWNVEPEPIDYRGWSIYHEECSDSEKVHYHILCGYESLEAVKRLIDFLMDNKIEPDCHW